MIDDELKKLENEPEAQELMNLLKEQRGEENRSMEPARKYRPYARKNTPKGWLRPVSPLWLAAALMVGFLAGAVVMQRQGAMENDGRYTLLADSLSAGRSLAQNDVTLSLIVYK